MNEKTNDHRFLKACRREPVDRTPIWLMRQAGRYMSEYLRVRERYGILDIIKTPELACEVTMQPLNAFDLDAGIIFSDILPPLEGMGLKLEFAQGEGPVIHNPIRSAADVERLTVRPPEETMSFTLDAIRLVRRELGDTGVPLIGFSGAPFTLACYAIEGGGSRAFLLAKRTMTADPDSWRLLMQKLSEVVSAYLLAQADAGANALQIFDTWVGELSPAEFKTNVMPYLRTIIETIRPAGVPLIYFGTNTNGMLDVLGELGADVVGVDWRIGLGDAWRRLGDGVAIQGNLDPTALFDPWDALAAKAALVLDEADGRLGHIFNLGHGILPATPVDNVKRLVDFVHERGVQKKVSDANTAGGTNTKRSAALHEQAKKLIPGGVNSPVRAFKSVGGVPRYIEKGDGAYVWDADGNRYVDYVLSWGPLVLGHANPVVLNALRDAAERGTSFGAPTHLETELAQLVVDAVPSVEMVRFVNSGTEATMSALRLARAYTGREKIIKFAGCYHGHADMLLVQAGSGVATLGLPDSPGVPAGTTADTLVVPYNDLDAVKEAFSTCPGAVAGVIVEPIAGNMGFVKGNPEFLTGLQELCRANGALFILDEVMTGFRVSVGGAQELFGLDPDLTCLGKVIGGGLPVGAYAGKSKIMQTVAPEGPMYQAGTLSGNPLAMSAGLATLRALTDGDLFAKISGNAAKLVEGVADIGLNCDIPVQTGCAGTMFGVYFLDAPGAVIVDFDTAKQHADTERYTRYFHAMLERGVYFAPSQFEAGFVSSAHTQDDIDFSLKAIREFMEADRQG